MTETPGRIHDVQEGLEEERSVGESDQDWKERIREFHLGGLVEDDAPLEPSIFLSDAWNGEMAERFPLYVNPEEPTSFVALRDLLKEATSGGGFSILSERLEALAAEMEAVMEAAGLASAAVAEIAAKAVERFPKHFEMSEAASRQLGEELKRLQAALPKQGELVAFRAEALPLIHVRLLSALRRKRRLEYGARVRTLVFRLEDILLVEKEHADADPGRVTEALGEEAERFFDTGALARSLKRAHGARSLEPERLARIEAALATLKAFLGQKTPLVYLVGSLDDSDHLKSDGVTVVRSEEGFQTAVELFDESMRDLDDVFRAVRVAELEADNDYRPELHDRVLRRFNWEAATEEEIEVAPAVVIHETEERISQNSLGQMGRLLRSGRPIQVLASRRSGLPADLSGYLPDIGYLAVAHREAFVLEGSLADPSTLTQGLLRMARSLRPALAAVAVPGAEGGATGRWQSAAAARVGRISPGYVYDPDGGESWGRKFSLVGNPQPEKTWAAGSYSGLGDAEEEFTPAQAAALDSSMRRHFWVIPEEAWSDEQVEIGEYLRSFDRAAPAAAPYLRVMGQDGRTARAVVSRELAHACWDRRRAWRIYQELAGLHNQYVEEAVAEAEARVRRESAERERKLVDEAREAGAAEAIDRLVTALLNPEALVAPAAEAPRPALAPAPAKEAPAAVQPEPAPVGADEPEEEEIEEEAYIDSFLCTSCNDCININSLMFGYNDEKQAIIKDRSAGTYAELVKAAAACPAKCIHPGAEPK